MFCSEGEVEEEAVDAGIDWELLERSLLGSGREESHQVGGLLELLSRVTVGYLVGRIQG